MNQDCRPTYTIYNKSILKLKYNPQNTSVQSLRDISIGTSYVYLFWRLQASKYTVTMSYQLYINKKCMLKIYGYILKTWKHTKIILPTDKDTD